MIGLDGLNRMYQLIEEGPSSEWVDKKTSFDFWYEAAKDMAKETKSIHGTQIITTVANQSSYDLNPDFIGILPTDGNDNPAIKYSNGTYDTWLTQKSYDSIIYGNNTTAALIPSNFAICDAAIPVQLTGTATSASATAVGQCILADTAATFTTVYAGDTVYNATKAHIGVVLSVTDSHNIVTALFDTESRGAPYSSGWTSGDAYIIQKSSRFQLVLSQPPSTSAHTITMHYYRFPAPVYSDYGTYPFPTGYDEALIKYAIWLYQYRDKQPDYGNIFYQVYDTAVRKAKNVHNSATGKKSFTVSWNAR